MFHKTSTALAVIVLFATGTAQAQDSQRVEITGSAIKRIDAETALPVTVLKAEDLKKQGISTIEQVMASIPGLQSTQTTSQTVGTSTGGASFADLRGVGPNKTLVLLNGRRIANNAFDGSAPDLNMIPFAAIERIEVLRDGASALYGTDAIGGVINFITRSNYTGGTITLGADVPEHAGGKAHNLNAGFGFGDLDQQGFNVFGFVDYQKQDHIGGTQRPFNTRVPAGGPSGSTSPANYFQGDTVFNPAGPTCASGTFLVPNGDGTSCTMATARFVDYVPESERVSGMLKGTLKLTPDHNLGLEYFYTQSKVSTIIAPVPYGALVQNALRPDGTPNPYYAGNFNSAISPTFDPKDTSLVGDTLTDGGTPIAPGYVNVKWRDLPNGPRGDENTNTQQRLVASLEGNIAGWDYNAGISYNENKVVEKLISGYNNGDIIQEGVLTGVINPFGDQDAAGTALLNSALLPGTLLQGKGTTSGLDVRASREIGDWLGAGRQAAIAFGGEYRHEKFEQAANTDYAELVVASTGVDPALLSAGSRSVYAAYTELNVPILKNLEVTAALRYDKYSDFGSTTNPKFSFRYQPVQQLLVRGSYTTGFRAPSLYDLYAGQTYTNTSTLDDPVTCPNGKETGQRINNCGAQFQALNGGNPNLQPEKSKSGTLGFVFEPMTDVSLGIDFWWIRLRNQIGTLADTTAFDLNNQAQFGSLFVRNAAGQLSVDGTQCPGANCGYVDLRTQNLGNLDTHGIDLSASYRVRTSVGSFNVAYNSTYVSKYEYQDYTDGPYNQNVGVFVGVGPIFRWQHTLTGLWNLGEYSAGATLHNKSGYLDQDGENHVSQYTTVDVFGAWQPTKQLAMTLGIRNLFDRDPPYSVQTYVFQAGYDPRYTDPAGRTYYVRGTYNF